MDHHVLCTHIYTSIYANETWSVIMLQNVLLYVGLSEETIPLKIQKAINCFFLYQRIYLFFHCSLQVIENIINQYKNPDLCNFNNDYDVLETFIE